MIVYKISVFIIAISLIVLFLCSCGFTSASTLIEEWIVVAGIAEEAAEKIEKIEKSNDNN